MIGARNAGRPLVRGGLAAVGALPDPVDPRCSFLGAGPSRAKLPRDAKIYIDKFSDLGDGDAKRPGHAADLPPRGEVHGKVVRGAGHRDGEEAQRGVRAGRLRARDDEGGARELFRRGRHEIDAAGGGGGRGRMRVRRSRSASRTPISPSRPSSPRAREKWSCAATESWAAPSGRPAGPG